MKKHFLYIVGLALLFASCKKSSSTSASPSVNNNTSVSAFSVDGISDVEFDNTGGTFLMPVTFTYHDSAQQSVTASISGAPSFMDIYRIETFTYSSYTSYGPWTFIPTYTLPLYIHVPSSGGGGGTGYVSGTYKITLTAAGSTSGTKTFSFNVICH